ncbi:MAG TPA: c-type cytochrome [Gemmatimonadaceae bacterium]|nr:c-type cytochrome [Gemmatimonadaceae bacterium]
MLFALAFVLLAVWFLAIGFLQVTRGYVPIFPRALPGARSGPYARAAWTVSLAALASISLAACTSGGARGEVDSTASGASEAIDEGSPELIAEGRRTFRFETFGNERFWTDTARLHEVVQRSVSPAIALKVGLKVDADAIPTDVARAIKAGEVDLDSPATTVTLLKLDAVIGLKGTVTTVNGKDSLTHLGITCALCHSNVDDSFAPGIGRRQDGWSNRDLDIGAIVALSPAITPVQKAVYASWGPGKYDPRYNLDGASTPLVLPPVYGLAQVKNETYTAEGPMSYWNAYVAVTQMHGQGNFSDPRLGIEIRQSPDLVTPKLAALRGYQHSLEAPRPPAGTVDTVAAVRGRQVFDDGCATCHVGATGTDNNAGALHAPAETGMNAAYAMRTATKMYRTTPLRALWQHAPYFHDGSAATLAAVVEHYDRVRQLRLSDAQKRDLVEYLKSL